MIAAKKRQNDLRNESRDKAIHSYMQSTLDIDVVGNNERGGESIFLSIRALVNIQLLSVFVQ